MKILRFILLSVILISGAASLHAQSREEAAVLFFKANEFYKQAQYDQAVQAYEEILRKGLASGPVYYNLGNSYFKNGQMGRAILNYDRALELDPRDADIRANHTFARSQIRGDFLRPQGFWDRLWDSHISFYTVDEMAIIVFLILFFIALIHLASLYMQWPSFRRTKVLGVLIFVLIIFAYGLKVKTEYNRDAAIAVSSTSAQYEPLENATSYFDVPEGMRVRILREEDGWTKIERRDGRLGWIRSKTVERI